LIKLTTVYFMQERKNQITIYLKMFEIWGALEY